MKNNIVALTVTCNRLSITRQWLDQLKLKNKGVKFPHIIIDNGSTDGTVDWLRSQGYEIMSLNKNIGQAAALRLGWEYALSKYDPKYYVKFDDDCEVITDGILEKMANFLDQCDSHIVAPINIELEMEEFKAYFPTIYGKSKEKGHEIWNVSHTGGIVQMMPKKAVQLLLARKDDILGDMARCRIFIERGIDPVFLYDLKVMHRGGANQTKNYKL